MHDMLVKLYDLPSVEDALAAVGKHGVIVRRAIAPEKPVIVDWVRAGFASSMPEVECAFAHVPVRCFIATRDEAVLGFACHDVTCLNFFGPEGVAASERDWLGRNLPDGYPSEQTRDLCSDQSPGGTHDGELCANHPYH